MSEIHHRTLSFFIALSLVFILNSPTLAVIKTWDNGGLTGFWDEDDNWSLDEKPQPDDDAIVGGNPEVNTLEIFNELTNNGTIDITTGALQPLGDIENAGTINVGDGSAINSKLAVGNSVTISGGGAVVLQNSDDLPASNATLSGGAGGSAVTNGSNHTIRGEGTINLHWINEGMVRAEATGGAASAVLRLDNTTFVNNGELRSSPGASIALISATYSQGSGGQLFADTGNIALTGSSIRGGSLESVGGGVFELTQGNNQIILMGVTINAPINNVHTTGNGVIRGNAAGITNNSTITLDGANSNSAAQFGFTESGTLDGTGEIVLVSGDTRTLIGVLPGTPFEFTQGANHTIRGAGVIGESIINNGTIRAEPGTNGVILQFNKPQTNNGLMEAGSGATLRFNPNVSNTTQSASGIISAADGGRVELDAQMITGGTLQTTGSGVIAVDDNSTTLSDLAIAAGGALNVSGGRTLRLIGTTITNNGSITLNSNGVNSASNLQLNSSLTLDGTGEVVLNTTGVQTARIWPAAGGHVLTHGANHTIRGDGVLDGEIVNNGRIEGDSKTENIDIFGRLSGTGTLKNVGIGNSGFFGTGTHAPGGDIPATRTAVVPLEGSYTLSNAFAILEIEIGGTTPGSGHDQLASTGTVDLGGMLDVSLIDLGNSYTPTAGDRFDIVTSANTDITGTFFAANFPDFALGHSLTWAPVDFSDPRKVTLEIASAAPYDVDLDDDGDVDGADFLAIQRTDPSLIPAWEFEYGSGVGPLSTAQSVPEPSGFALLSIELAAVAGFRRRFCAG